MEVQRGAVVARPAGRERSAVDQVAKERAPLRLARYGMFGGLPATNDVSLYMDCIADQMRALGVEVVHPAFLNKHNNTAFKTRCTMVSSYLQGLNRDERIKMVSMGITLLYHNLLEQGFPVTSFVIMNHFHRIPAMLNKAFPGAAENGYLSVIAHAQPIHNEQDV